MSDNSRPAITSEEPSEDALIGQRPLCSAAPTLFTKSLHFERYVGRNSPHLVRDDH
jgi:hypothetical protein